MAKKSKTERPSVDNKEASPDKAKAAPSYGDKMRRKYEERLKIRRGRK